ADGSAPPSASARRPGDALAARIAMPPEIPEELLDPDAVKVVRRLRRAGHEAYLVGGCVRDLLLGIRPKDFDVAASAHPNQVREIHTIGTPDVRMREDPVRILRAIRFAAKCAFDLEPQTAEAMKAHVHEIPRCAPPRVLEEVLKLLRSGAARRSFELLREVGALRILLPPVAAYLERRGGDEAERHLPALEAPDEHVRAGESPSDAGLLATLLAPLPRDAQRRGPIPKASQAQPPAAAEKADEELEREL